MARWIGLGACEPPASEIPAVISGRSRSSRRPGGARCNRRNRRVAAAASLRARCLSVVRDPVDRDDKNRCARLSEDCGSTGTGRHVAWEALNPEVAGSNPAPQQAKGQVTGGAGRPAPPLFGPIALVAKDQSRDHLCRLRLERRIAWLWTSIVNATVAWP